MATLGNITGTVTIGFDGHDTLSVSQFEVPVTTGIDQETGDVHLELATDEAIRTAAATALREAADRLLAATPTATVTVSEGDLEDALSEDGHVLTCPTCGIEMTWNGPATLEHADNGAHVFTPRYI